MGPEIEVIPSQAMIATMAIQSGFRPLTVPDDLFLFNMFNKTLQFDRTKLHNLPAMQFCSHKGRHIIQSLAKISPAN